MMGKGWLSSSCCAVSDGSVAVRPGMGANWKAQGALVCHTESQGG